MQAALLSSLLAVITSLATVGVALVTRTRERSTIGREKPEDDRVAGLLARLGGAPKLLLHGRAYSTFVAIGVGNIVSFALTAISLGLLGALLNLDPVSRFVVPLIVATIVTALDRATVSSFQAVGRVRYLLLLTPRFALAVISGIVITTTLLLLMFQPAIAVQLKQSRQDAINRQIKDLTAQQLYLQAQITAVEAPDTSSDREVQDAQARLDAITQEYAVAERRVLCESDGTCGTGLPGRGPNFAELQTSANRLAAERADAQRQLEDARSRAAVRLSATARASQERNTQSVNQVNTQIADLRDEQTALIGQPGLYGQPLADQVTALYNLVHASIASTAVALAVFVLMTALTLLPLSLALLLLRRDLTPGGYELGTRESLESDDKARRTVGLAGTKEDG